MLQTLDTYEEENKEAVKETKMVRPDDILNQSAAKYVAQTR